MKLRQIASIALSLLALNNTVVADVPSAEKALQAKDYTAALSQVDAVLKKQPDNYAAQFLKARVLTAQQKNNSAIAIYEALIRQAPDRPEAFNNLAMLYAAKGDLETARQLLEKGIKTNKSYATVYDNLSKVYVEMARDSYGKALKLNLARQSVALTGLTSPGTTANTAANSTTVVLADASNSGNETSAVPVPKTAQINQVQPKQEKVTQEASASQQPVATAETKKPVVKTTSKSVVKPVQSKPADVAVKPQTVKVNKEELVTTLQGWAAAWSAQQVDLYLSFYDEHYHPTGVSRQDWVAERRVRVKKPKWVQVTLNDIEVAENLGEQVVVKLVQKYRSNSYQDKTKKQLLLKKTMDGWRILSETSIALIK